MRPTLNRADKIISRLAMTLICVFLVIQLFGMPNVDDAFANGIFVDYIREGTIPEPFYCDLPPKILLTSPQNNRVCWGQNVTASLNVSCADTGASLPLHTKSLPSVLTQVYYKTDWQPNQTYLANFSDIDKLSTDLSFADVPEGNHSITAYAVERRSYETRTREYFNGFSYKLYYQSYDVLGNSTVAFVVDKTPPIVSRLSPKNKTYTFSDVQLVFAVSEPVSQVWYAIDGEDKAMINGNTTLTDLPNGLHTLTVYANDIAGNVGASETTTFTATEQPEPFPATPVFFAFGALVALVSVCLLLYSKKCKGKAEIS